MYFKESLPLIRRSDLSIMKESLETEINVNIEKCFFTCFFTSIGPQVKVMWSQKVYLLDSLDSLLSNINDQHPACSIVIDDFNAKCSLN